MMEEGIAEGSSCFVVSGRIPKLCVSFLNYQKVPKDLSRDNRPGFRKGPFLVSFFLAFLIVFTATWVQPLEDVMGH